MADNKAVSKDMSNHNKRTYSNAVIGQMKAMLELYKHNNNARFLVTDTTITKAPSSSSSSSTTATTALAGLAVSAAAAPEPEPEPELED